MRTSKIFVAVPFGSFWCLLIPKIPSAKRTKPRRIVVGSTCGRVRTFDLVEPFSRYYLDNTPVLAPFGSALALWHDSSPGNSSVCLIIVNAELPVAPWCLFRA